jgi:hypothetical protein
MDVPTTDDMKTKYTSNELIQFYKTYIESSHARNITFNGLSRSMAYRLACTLETNHANETIRTSTKLVKDTYTYIVNNVSMTESFSPVDQYPTLCTEFVFDQKPNNNTLANVVNNCQKVMSANGFYQSGCPICTDVDITYYAPGLLLYQMECQNTLSSRLRYLQKVTSTSNTTTLITTTTQTTTNVTNTNATTTNTTANNTTAANATITDTTSVVPFIYSNSTNGTWVLKTCVYSNPNCPTNRNPLIQDYKYAYYNSTDNYQNAYNETNNKIIKVINYEDSVASNITNLQISYFNYTMDGYTEWIARLGTPVNCRWLYRSVAFDAVPTFDIIYNCRTANCGSGKANAIGMKTTADRNNLFPLSNSTKYNLYYACYNDVPRASVRSDINLVYSWTTPIGKNDSNSQVVPIGSGYLSMTYVMILLYFVLFN